MRKLMSILRSRKGQAAAAVSPAGNGRGWVNKLCSVSTRIPRSVSRLSFRRVLLMLLGAISTSIASHTCRARSGASAVANTTMICW
ncbi:hypothetical protein AB0C90_39435 [Streptomyces sp. NPDC048550]|uniref:hypothetical protein n=1 Tax=Streptomyces sp. NPDC048550 TaxID=3155739 RepID=UPI00344710A9